MSMPLFEILTIGFPFCVFKLLAGLSAGGPAGTILIVLGAADLAINSVNLAGLLLKGRRPLPVCVLALAAGSLRWSGPRAKRQDLGAAFDVLLSFALVALMIGLGRLGALPPLQLAAWNASVILNVLGAGVGRIGASLQNLATPHAR